MIAKINPNTADRDNKDEALTTPILFMLCKYRYSDIANPKTAKMTIGSNCSL